MHQRARTKSKPASATPLALQHIALLLPSIVGPLGWTPTSHHAGSHGTPSARPHWPHRTPHHATGARHETPSHWAPHHAHTPVHHGVATARTPHGASAAPCLKWPAYAAGKVPQCNSVIVRVGPYIYCYVIDTICVRPQYHKRQCTVVLQAGNACMPAW